MSAPEISSTIAIKLGGSVAFDEGIDESFMRQFTDFLRDMTRAGTRIVVVVGGGDINRRYLTVATNVADLPDVERDMIGIYASRLNATLFRSILHDIAAPELYDRQGKYAEFGAHDIVVGAAWAPGWSTDYVTTRIASDMGIGRVVILSNVSHIYGGFGTDSTEKLGEVTFREYINMIPDEWEPRMSVPVDPVAARFAKDHSMEIVVADGRDIDNTRAIINGEHYTGTRMYV